MDFYLYEMKRPDLALAAARGKLNAMQTLEQRLANAKMAPDVLATVRKELRQIYLEEASKPRPDAWLVSLAAEAEQRAGNDKHAIELYREALTIDYGAVSCRLALARLLLQTGDRDGAKREAQICLRLQPHLAEAENLIAEVSQDHPRPTE
jgi:predicted Zn-dependent protease